VVAVDGLEIESRSVTFSDAATADSDVTAIVSSVARSATARGTVIRFTFAPHSFTLTKHPTRMTIPADDITVELQPSFGFGEFYRFHNLPD
jgi:hypothetical protein